MGKEKKKDRIYPRQKRKRGMEREKAKYNQGSSLGMEGDIGK